MLALSQLNGNVFANRRYHALTQEIKIVKNSPGTKSATASKCTKNQQFWLNGFFFDFVSFVFILDICFSRKKFHPKQFNCSFFRENLLKNK